MRCMLGLIVCMLSCGDPVWAQEAPVPPSEEKPRLFLKLGLAHMPPLQEEAPQGIASWNLDLENDFGRENWVISAISIGYRKENSISFLSGHLMNFKASHHFKAKPFNIATRVGLEWGSPSTKYTFSQQPSSSTTRTVSLGRQPVDATNPRTSITLYPIAELSLRKRTKKTLVEAGLRMNVLKFRVEEREFRSGGVYTSIRRNYEVAPSIFMNIGFGVKK